MLEHVLATGDQLRWTAALEVPSLPGADDLVLAGMGGSGMAARVGALTVPGTRMSLHQGYGLPMWARERRTAVVAVSYSGNTEETLSVVEAALETGNPLVAITTGGAVAALAADEGFPVVMVPGGLQPRAALAYQAGAVTQVLASLTGRSSPGDDLEETARLVDDLLGGGQGAAATLGRDLADGLYGRMAVVYGSHGVGSVAASRWKAQINENAKMPAFSSEIPEADHNELEGWSALPELGARTVGAVMLHDPTAHPQIDKRMRLTAELVADSVQHVGDVVAQGATPLQRFFSLAVVGDVASVRLAELAGVDPTPVQLLEDFKNRLRED